MGYLAGLWNQLDQCLCSHVHYCYPQVPLKPPSCHTNCSLQLSALLQFFCLSSPQGGLFRPLGSTTKNTSYLLPCSHSTHPPIATYLTSHHTLWSQQQIQGSFTKRISRDHRQECHLGNSVLPWACCKDQCSVKLMKHITEGIKWVNDKRKKEAKWVPLWWKSPIWHTRWPWRTRCRKQPPPAGVLAAWAPCWMYSAPGGGEPGRWALTGLHELRNLEGKGAAAAQNSGCPTQPQRMLCSNHSRPRRARWASPGPEYPFFGRET